MSEAPHSPAAEASVVLQMMARPNVIGEVIGTLVEPTDFFRQDSRLLYEAIVESYYADDSVTPVSIGEKVRVPLASLWGCDESAVSQRLHSRAGRESFGTKATDYANIVKRHGESRRILWIAEAAIESINSGEYAPEQVADMLTSEVNNVTAGTQQRAEIIPWLELGRRYLEHLQKARAARESGYELAAYFGMKFVDDWVRGLAPTELCMIAGEPGVGKSAVVWKASEGFARRQLLKPPDKRVGTLILSLEMGLVPSTGRVAQSIAGIDGTKLREAEVTDDELAKIAKQWKNVEDLPLYFNFASNFKMSQMRALIVEGIRRYNIGLVVIDHFRMTDLDRRVHNPVEADEEKVRFLKESLAKDLNVAVVCLAHTVKIKRETSDGRPQLTDLRGSYQVAAHCDVVGFVYRPYMYATENELLEGVKSETDAEMLWRKMRHGQSGVAPFHFDPKTMIVRDKLTVQ